MAIERVFGIDFSGATAAGRCIWIAEAHPSRDGIVIDSCRAACELPQSGIPREACLPALVRFIADLDHAVVGCDFPFSLPHRLMLARRWRDFARGFGDRFATAETFLQDCRDRADGREIRRACDRESRVPFAAYNLRIYRQTYHGIRDILCPLIANDAAAVLPMEQPVAGRPWLIETCPASTLKSLGLYISYKGRTDSHRRVRRRLIQELTHRRLLSPLEPSLRRIVEDDAGGDALDSLIAAAATARGLQRGAFAARHPDPIESLEGRVYF